MASDAERFAGAIEWRWLGGAHWLLLALAVADWLALRKGILRHPPAVLAALTGILAVALTARLAAVLRRAWRRRRRPASAGGELALLAGILLALGAGMANWLLGLQGFIVLHEKEAVPLHEGSHLQELTAGPLARLGEMHLMLALVEVELLPAGNGPAGSGPAGSGPAGSGLFFPRSRLEVRRGEEEPAILEIEPGRPGASGSLRFYQGAFGFAPRIVILRGGETVFDRVVPFTSERHGPAGIVFAGLFTIAAEQLEVEGRVDLASLDEGMRGHATLHLEVRRDGASLGHGSLLPGHFAEMAQGYRVGFAGLERWSEIDISRRHYGKMVLAGTAVALAGAVLWPLARWRGW